MKRHRSHTTSVNESRSGHQRRTQPERALSTAFALALVPRPLRAKTSKDTTGAWLHLFGVPSVESRGGRVRLARGHLGCEGRMDLARSPSRLSYQSDGEGGRAISSLSGLTPSFILCLFLRLFFLPSLSCRPRPAGSPPPPPLSPFRSSPGSQPHAAGRLREPLVRVTVSESEHVSWSGRILVNIISSKKFFGK